MADQQRIWKIWAEEDEVRDQIERIKQRVFEFVRAERAKGKTGPLKWPSQTPTTTDDKNP